MNDSRIQMLQMQMQVTVLGFVKGAPIAAIKAAGAQP